MSLFKNISSLRNQIDYSSKEGLVELSGETLNKLQDTLFSMYSDIYAVCQKYDITPFLTGGSELGAIRHKNFIPWDDDFDIAMTRKDHDKFLKIFENELSDKYVLNAPNYSNRAKARFTKIMKKGTLCRQIGDKSPASQCGVFMDVFVIDNVPNNSVHRKIKGLMCNAAEFISSQVWLSELREYSQKDTIFKIRRFIGICFSFLSSNEWFNLIDRIVKYRDENSDCCALPTGRKHYFGEILKREDIFPPRYVVFRNTKVPVFNHVEVHLEKLYGKDYMKLPPENKRERHLIERLKL